MSIPAAITKYIYEHYIKDKKVSFMKAFNLIKELEYLKIL